MKEPMRINNLDFEYDELADTELETVAGGKGIIGDALGWIGLGGSQPSQPAPPPVMGSFPPMPSCPHQTSSYQSGMGRLRGSFLQWLLGF